MICMLIICVMVFLFFILLNGVHRVLHSFPTRRSSDLSETGCGTLVVQTSSINTFGYSSGHADVHRTHWSNQRSEEHTSELQSLTNLVCRLLLEKKRQQQTVAAPRLVIVVG